MSQFSTFEASFSPAAPRSTLRRLVRSKRTNAFLTAQGAWTKDVRQAAHFADQSRAQVAVKQFCLRDAELYYLFDDEVNPRYDFAIPLQ